MATSERPAENDTPPSIVSEGVLLATVPAVSYLVAYGFEFGYCLAMAIPRALIAIGLSDVLLASMVVIFVGIVVAPTALTGFWAMDRIQNRWLRCATPGLVSLPWLIPTSIWYPTFWPIWGAGYALAGTITVAEILMPLRDRIQASDDIGPLTSFVLAKRHRSVRVPILSSVMLVDVAFLVGHAYANLRTVFPVLGDDAVVAIYGEHLVLTPIDAACPGDSDGTTRKFTILTLEKLDAPIEIRNLGARAPCAVVPSFSRRIGKPP